MAINGSLGLGLVFRAQDFATGTIGRIRRSFEALEERAQQSGRSIKGSFKQAAGGLAAFAVGTAGLKGALGLANAAAPFELQMARVAAISRVTKEELNSLGLTTAALDTAMNSKFTPEETAQGLQNLAAQGFNAREQIRLLKPAVNLAQGGLISMDQATRTVAAATRVFRLDADQAAGAADNLLKISNLTALTANDLEIALGNVSRGAKVADQSFNSMLLSVGLIRNTGVDASVASTGVSSALQFMAKKADKFKKKLGVSITDASGNFKDFMDLSLEVRNALDKRFSNAAKRAAVTAELFGRFGSSAFLAVSDQIRNGIPTATGEILKGADAIAHLQEQMANSGGTAEEFMDKVLDTFQGQKDLLRGAISALLVEVGTPIIEELKPIIKGLIEAIKGVMEWFKELSPETKKLFAQIFLGVSALLTLGGAFFFLKGAFGLFMALMGSAFSPIATLFGWIKKLVQGFALLDLGLTEKLVSKGPAIRGFFGKLSSGAASASRAMWNMAKQGAQQAVIGLRMMGQSALGTARALGGKILGALRAFRASAFMTAIATKAAAIGTTLLSTAIAVLTSPITWIIAAVIALALGIRWLWRNSETFRGIILTLWDAVKSLFGWWIDVYKKLWDIAKTVFSAIADWIGNKIVNRINFFLKVVDKIKVAFKAVGAFVKSVFDKIVDGIRAAIDWIKLKLINLVDKLPDKVLPDSTIQFIRETRAEIEVDRAIRAGQVKGDDATRSNLVSEASRVGLTEDQVSAQNGNFMAALRAAQAEQSDKQKQPQTINLVVDGETLAQVVTDKKEEEESRNFD